MTARPQPPGTPGCAGGGSYASASTRFTCNWLFWRFGRKRGEFGVRAAKGWVQAQLGVKLAPPGHAACAQRQRVDSAQRESGIAAAPAVRRAQGEKTKRTHLAQLARGGISSRGQSLIVVHSKSKLERQHVTCLLHPTAPRSHGPHRLFGAVGLETAHGRYGAGCQARQVP